MYALWMTVTVTATAAVTGSTPAASANSAWTKILRNTGHGSMAAENSDRLRLLGAIGSTRRFLGAYRAARLVRDKYTCLRKVSAPS